MQTLEKALHQPMPFTSGGQTISDRLTAAKHALAGSTVGRSICKATTEEVIAPKQKHLDYLLHCTNEPNISIPSMVNLLVERTSHPNWAVVYKALIATHHLMCYGNERFTQYIATCNINFVLGDFFDRSSDGAMEMSQHVRRYSKYLTEKISSYQLCDFDFCRVKRGREDALLRIMHVDKLTIIMPILQNQIDTLLEFQVISTDLCNGIIIGSFILLFRDLIRLFACYNDGIINLLEKYFDMPAEQCKETVDLYKGFLGRLDKVAEFLKNAEFVGMDKSEIPDLTRAPASLLEALEAHLAGVVDGRPPTPQAFSSQYKDVNDSSGDAGCSTTEQERLRYIEKQREFLNEIEAKKKQQESFKPLLDFLSPEAPKLAVADREKSASRNHIEDLMDIRFTSPHLQMIPATAPNSLQMLTPSTNWGSISPAMMSASMPSMTQMGQQHLQQQMQPLLYNGNMPNIPYTPSQMQWNRNLPGAYSQYQELPRLDHHQAFPGMAGMQPLQRQSVFPAQQQTGPFTPF